MIHDRLGQTVLSYRKKNNMTIREFADYAGISTSLISQIERGHANPSLNVLELIAKALNVPLFTLLLTISIQIRSFLRKRSKKVYRENNDHIVYDVLTPDFMKARIEMLMMDLNKRANTTESHYSHEDKEEIAVIMKGKCMWNWRKRIFFRRRRCCTYSTECEASILNKSDESNHILFVLTPSLG